uniref:Plastid-encoded RNA polymerase subunit alpha n=1 Tax=Marvania geminata TaxID=97105 RepID=A0A097KRA1_9CHLO|nr:alpha subunit of RNA polymerase [Marvania geminata]AIT95694.1 alpha subunit of RNA polymerase [Marvania geminata]
MMHKPMRASHDAAASLSMKSGFEKSSNSTKNSSNSTKFVSHIESRIEEKSTLYGHFQLGTFVSGQALTIANALRRTLLAEIPAFVITSVQIEGGEIISPKAGMALEEMLSDKVLSPKNASDASEQQLSIEQSRIDRDRFASRSDTPSPSLQEESLNPRQSLSRKLQKSDDFTKVENNSQTIHEFSSLPGMHENVLNLLLNLKRTVLVSNKFLGEAQHNFFSIDEKRASPTHFTASLNIRGPRVVTAGMIHFPKPLAVVDPSHYLATLSATGELKLDIKIEFVDPCFLTKFEKSMLDLSFIENDHEQKAKPIKLDPVPKPVKQVNFGIFELPNQPGKEYISFEIRTDGSITPKEALDFSLEKLTRLFLSLLHYIKKFLSNNITASKRNLFCNSMGSFAALHKGADALVVFDRPSQMKIFFIILRKKGFTLQRYTFSSEKIHTVFIRRQ